MSDVNEATGYMRDLIEALVELRSGRRPWSEVRRALERIRKRGEHFVADGVVSQLWERTFALVAREGGWARLWTYWMRLKFSRIR